MHSHIHTDFFPPSMSTFLFLPPLPLLTNFLYCFLSWKILSIQLLSVSFFSMFHVSLMFFFFFTYSTLYKSCTSSSRLFWLHVCEVLKVTLVFLRPWLYPVVCCHSLHTLTPPATALEQCLQFEFLRPDHNTVMCCGKESWQRFTGSDRLKQCNSHFTVFHMTSVWCHTMTMWTDLTTHMHAHTQWQYIII